MMSLCWFGRKKLTLFLLVSIILFLISCGGNNSGLEGFPKGITKFDALPQDFQDFHKRFHKDSVFQINRINFPLRGLPAHFTEKDINFAWEDSTWILHKEFDTNLKTYSREWTIYENNEIEESITSTEADFGMTRTFKQSGGHWYLVYYAAMNRLSNSGNPVGREEENIYPKDSMQEIEF